MKRLSHNVLANIIQTLIGSILLFALYRYINNAIGIELFGIWSLVMAAVTTARLAEFGIGSAVTKFIASATINDEQDRITKIIDSSVLITGAATLVGGLALWPFLEKGISATVGQEYKSIISSLIPLAITSFALSSTSAVILSSLDGLKEMTLRCALVLLGQLLLLLFSIPLIREYGIVGVGYAQIAQSVIVLVAARLIITCKIKTLNFIPTKFTWHIIKEMLSYGLNIQFQSIAQMLFDPAAKILLSLYAGPASVGYFEMASRIIQYARGLIISANRAIIPYIAAFDISREATAINVFYIKNVKIVGSLIIPLFTGLILASPLFSRHLIGHSSHEFNAMIIILSITWGINTLAAPAYFLNMGLGHVWKNTLSHVIVSVVSLLAGYACGKYYGSLGVTTGYGLGLVAGAIYLLVGVTPLKKWSP